ncbi:unnamed protein product [Ectocarpus sp. 6 AP-2014]
MSGSHLSRDFFELVKAIGESKSKQEEDRIIMHEVGVLKKKMPEANVAREKMKEFLVRMIYVEMLGHDASFAYIKAVELTASQNLVQKRTGYLTASLTLSPNHEFRFMLVNQMQRDLSSSNMLEAAAALTALCKLATVDMIPAVMTDVVRLLKHERELVRKKAVMVLHRMNQLDPDSVSHMGDHLRRMLCDKDPSVMGSALCLLHDLARVDASSYKDLVPSFVSILKQITEHRLPRDFDYHRMPAPWIQMRLLRILALLGRADQATSEGMYEVLMDVMRRADTGINVGYAVVYECVRTVTSIYPNAPLLDAAAASISRFISAENHNLKYVGVTGLAAIVRDHPKYAQQHQMAVIDCLEDPDETLKRKTLDLLYTMTNPVNVEFIADKLLSFLEQGTDSFWRQDLVNRITQCAERFAPSNSWYVGVMTRVFRLAGDMVKPEVAHNLMQLIAEGSGEDEDADVELRRNAVDSYLDLLETPAVPDLLMQVMAWVLGEYGSLASTPRGAREVSTKLCGVASGMSFRDPSTCGFVVTALMKLSAQSGEVSPPVAHLLTLYSQSKQSDLQQRCLEFLQLAREGPAAMAAVLPVDASCEDVEADENLSHLDGIVTAALSAGAVGYSPPAEAGEDSDDEEASAAMGGAGGGSSFNLTPYARPSQPMAASAAAPQAPLPPPQSSGGAGDPLSTADIFASGPRLRPVSKVWGRPKPGEQNQQQPQQSQSAAAAGAPGAGGRGETGAAAAAAASGYPPATTGAGPAGPSLGRGSGQSGTAPSQAPPPQQDPVAAALRAEKQKMAAMLFGGTGPAPATPPAAAAAPSRPKPISTSATAATFRPAAVATPVSSASSSSQQQPKAAQTTTAAAAAAAAADPVDLLDFASMGDSPPPPPPAGTASNGAAPAHDRASSDQLGVDLLGVGGGGDANGGASSSAPGGAPTLDDFLGGGGGGTTTTVGGAVPNGRRNSSSSAEQAWPPAPAAAAARQRAGTAGSSASSAATPSLIGSGGGVDLSALVLGDGGGSGAAAAATGFSFGGRGMKPLAIATGEFGQKWMACSGERRAAGSRFSPGLGSPKAVVERLGGRLGVHTVEVIPHTAEGICAGQLDGGGGVCLVHCKVWPSRGTVDITVRSSDAKLAEAAAAFAKTAVSQ